MRRETCEVPGAASGMWPALSSGVTLSGGKTREPRVAAQKSCQLVPPLLPPVWGTESFGPHLHSHLDAICNPDKCTNSCCARSTCLKTKHPSHLERNVSPRALLAGCLGRLLPPGSFPPSRGRSHTRVEWDKWDKRTVPERLERLLKSDTGNHCRVKPDSGPLCGAATPAGGPQLSLASASAPSMRSLRSHPKVFHRWEQT